MAKKVVSKRAAPRWYGWLVLVILGSSLLFGTIIRPGAFGGVADEMGGVLQVVIAVLLLIVALIVVGWLAWWAIQGLIRAGLYISDAQSAFWDDGRDLDDEDLDE